MEIQHKISMSYLSRCTYLSQWKTLHTLYIHINKFIINLSYFMLQNLNDFNIIAKNLEMYI
jgi:hypothetical protein